MVSALWRNISAERSMGFGGDIKPVASEGCAVWYGTVLNASTSPAQQIEIRRALMLDSCQWMLDW